MTSVAGASRYLSASTLANVRGLSPTTPSVLGDGGLGGVSILDGAYRPSNGIGLSARARALTNSYLSQASSSLNTILSLSTSEMGSTEVMRQTILALRASVPESQLSRVVRGETVDEAVSGLPKDDAEKTLDTEA
jgi:hypothetical protein